MLYGCSPFRGVTRRRARSEARDDAREPRHRDSEHEARRIVGYGGLFTADRDTRVGVVACGYADGYPRHAPTGTPVMVEGRMTRTLGRVSMDMLCADFRTFRRRGRARAPCCGARSVPVERVAAAAGTVGYQLLCALAPRVRIAEK